MRLPGPSKRRGGRQRPTSCCGSGAGTTASLLRRRRLQVRLPSGSPPSFPHGCSQDSHPDPRTLRGHSLQLGRVFDSGVELRTEPSSCAPNMEQWYWERADALCRSCGIPGGRTSQLRKLRSGVFPNKRYPGWTVEDVRRPSLDEATPLVAQLESCEAGLGRTVMGLTTPKKQRAAPQAAGLEHWERISATVNAEDNALQRWDQARSGLLAAYGLNDQLLSKPYRPRALSLARQTEELATHVLFNSLRSTAQA